MAFGAQLATFLYIWIVNTAWVFTLLWALFNLLFLFPLFNVGSAIALSLFQAGSYTIAAVTALFQLYFLFFDTLSWFVYWCLTLFGPLVYTFVKWLTMGVVDIPDIYRQLIVLASRVIAFLFVVGTFMAAVTWAYDRQSDTQVVFDFAWCQLIPFLQPFFDAWNLLVDFYETIVEPINILLAYVYRFLREVWDAFWLLVFRLISLAGRFWADPVNAVDFTKCGFVTCGSPFLVRRAPFCIRGDWESDDACIVRELLCWALDVLDFAVNDILGGVLRLIVPSTAANLAVNIVFSLVDTVALFIDSFFAVAYPCLEFGCSLSNPIAGGNPTSEEARTCFNDRTRCIAVRWSCWIFYWLTVLFGSSELFCEFFVGLVDILFSAIIPASGIDTGIGISFGPGDLGSLASLTLGGAIKEFLRVIRFVLLIVTNLGGLLAEVFNILIEPIESLLNATRAIVDNLVALFDNLVQNPLGVLFRLPGQLLSFGNPIGNRLAQLGIRVFESPFGSVPISGFSGLPSQIGNLADRVTDLANQISNLGGGGIFGGGGGIFGRRRLLEVPEHHFPAFISDDFQERIAEVAGVPKEDAILVASLIEIATNNMWTGMGITERCRPVLEGIEGLPSSRTEDREVIFCTMQYINARQMYHLFPDHTSWPEYHLLTYNTLLPPGDFCKSVLEQDFIEHWSAAEIEAVNEQRPDVWLYDIYAPCWSLYAKSFYRVHNTTIKHHEAIKYAHLFMNGTGADIPLVEYDVPTHFSTSKMHDQHDRDMFILMMQLIMLPHRRIPAKPTDHWVYRAVSTMQDARIAGHHTYAMSRDEAIQAQTRAQASFFRKPGYYHVIGEHSINHERDRRGMDKAHSAFEAFSWSKTIARAKTIDRSTKNHGVRHNIAKVMSWTIMDWERDPLRHQKRQVALLRGPQGKAPRLHLTAMSVRDFNLNDIIATFIEPLFQLVLVILELLVSLLRMLGLDFIVQVLEEFIDYVASVDYNQVLSDLADLALDYIQCVRKFFVCDPPKYYDALDNPGGCWKLPCLLQLKLPPELPRAPDDLATTIIEWGAPCLGPVGTCQWDGEFPGTDFPQGIFDDVPFPLVTEVPCPAGYESCTVIGFTDGFDVLIWNIQKISQDGPVDIIGFLRSDTFSTIVTTPLNILGWLLTPVAPLLGIEDVVADLRSASDVRDLPYIGPIVYRWEPLEESDFHDFCVSWGFPLTLLALILTIFFGIAFVLYLFYLPALLLTAGRLLLAVPFLPFFALGLVLSSRWRQRWDDPVYVREQEPGLYEGDNGAFRITPDAEAPVGAGVGARVPGGQLRYRGV